MTRKDYQLIASVLANFATEGTPTDDRDAIAYGLADSLAQDNPRFNRERFLVASGVWTGCSVCGDRMRYVTGQGEWCEAHLPEWAKKIKSQISSVA
jgi:hypothetical protein